MLKPLKEAIAIMGGQVKFAKKLGLAQQTISAWVTTFKRAPAKHAISIEKMTKGKVTRHQLRPDIYPFE